MGFNKRRPNSCSKKNRHRGLMHVQISSKKAIKNLAKSSERTGQGSLEVTRGSGSSGRAAQLKWDWDSSKGVPRNTRNEEQICPSQAPSGAAKNQKAWRVTIHEQKTGTPGNPEWRIIKGSGWKTFNPAEKGSAHLGKMTTRRTAKKLSPRGKRT